MSGSWIRDKMLIFGLVGGVSDLEEACNAGVGAVGSIDSHTRLESFVHNLPQQPLLAVPVSRLVCTNDLRAYKAA